MIEDQQIYNIAKCERIFRIPLPEINESNPIKLCIYS